MAAVFVISDGFYKLNVQQRYSSNANTKPCTVRGMYFGILELNTVNG